MGLREYVMEGREGRTKGRKEKEEPESEEGHKEALKRGVRFSDLIGRSKQ